MSNLNLKGIWIPVEILLNEKLSDKEKMILSIILYLSRKNNYCYLTNKTISDLLKISITQVSKLINSLKNKKYINIEFKYNKNNKKIEMRKLIPLKLTTTYLTKVKYPIKQNFNYPIEKNFKDNKYNNNKNIYKIYGNKETQNNKIGYIKPNYNQEEYPPDFFDSLYEN